MTGNEKTLTLRDFRGLDCRADARDLRRIADGYNFLRENGTLRKRHGWRELFALSGKINGLFPYRRGTEDYLLIHAGNRLYMRQASGNTELRDITPADSLMLDRKSAAFLCGGVLYITGCGDLIRYDGETCESVYGSPHAKVPTTTEAIAPDSAESQTRKAKEDRNLLSPWRINTCRGQAGTGTQVFTLDAPIDSGDESPVTVEITTASGKITLSTYGKGNNLRYDNRAAVTPGYYYWNGRSVAYTRTLMGIWTLHDFDGETSRDTREYAASDKYTETESAGGSTVSYRRFEPLGYRVAYTYTASYSVTETDAPPVSPAYIWQAAGSTAEKYVGTVDRAAGKITLNKTDTEMPIDLTPPQAGQDNIVVRFRHESAEDRERVAFCRFGATFGEKGLPDRLFLAGNPLFPAADLWSERGDFAAFPAGNVTTCGTDAGALCGYLRLSDTTLALFKEGDGSGANLYTRDGENGMRPTALSVGAVPVSPAATADFCGEKLFLSADGVMALETGGTSLARRYTAPRSRFIDGLLTQNAHLRDATLCVHNGWLLLSLHDDCYISDTRAEREKTGGATQYEWWKLSGVPACAMLSLSGTLFFGTAAGKICAFDEHFTDRVVTAGETSETVVSAELLTPFTDLDAPGVRKTLRGVAALPDPQTPGVATVSVETSRGNFAAQTHGSSPFSFAETDFSDYSFGCGFPLCHGRHLRTRHVNLVRFRVRQAENTPCAVSELTLRYQLIKPFRGYR